jgi:hypothetical protein
MWECARGALCGSSVRAGLTTVSSSSARASVHRFNCTRMFRKGVFAVYYDPRIYIYKDTQKDGDTFALFNVERSEP